MEDGNKLKLVGITKCGEDELPDMIVRIAYFYDWIDGKGASVNNRINFPSGYDIVLLLADKPTREELRAKSKNTNINSIRYKKNY